MPPRKRKAFSFLDCGCLLFFTLLANLIASGCTRFKGGDCQFSLRLGLFDLYALVSETGLLARAPRTELKAPFPFGKDCCSFHFRKLEIFSLLACYGLGLDVKSLSLLLGALSLVRVGGIRCLLRAVWKQSHMRCERVGRVWCLTVLPYTVGASTRVHLLSSNRNY